MLTLYSQAPGPVLGPAPRRRARARAPPVQPRSQAQADGPDQEAAQVEAGGEAEREARPGQDAPAEHDRRPRDDRERHRHLLWKGVQPGGDQARDGRPLLGGVLDLLVSIRSGEWDVQRAVANVM